MTPTDSETRRKLGLPDDSWWCSTCGASTEEFQQTCATCKQWWADNPPREEQAMTTDNPTIPDVRDAFNQAIARAANPDTVARLELAREYFTNPAFRDWLTQTVWDQLNPEPLLSDYANQPSFGMWRIFS